MLRHVLVVLTLTLGMAMPAAAGSIGSSGLPAYGGVLYSPSSSPFEAFEWTSLDFAAFSAYGGDFANVRRPVSTITFAADPFLPSGEQGPDDEQPVLRLTNVPFFEGLPVSMQQPTFDEPSGEQDSIPEPGALLLVGVGLLGAAARLRRSVPID